MSSVPLSVTLVDFDDIGWNSSKIISRSVSLRCSLSAVPNIMGLVLVAEIGLGYVKSGFWRTKAVISLKRSKIGPRLLSLLLTTNRKCYMHFRLCQNQQPWMTLKVIIVSLM